MYPETIVQRVTNDKMLFSVWPVANPGGATWAN